MIWSRNQDQTMLGRSIRETQRAFAKGTLTPRELTRLALKRIKRVQPILNAATQTLDERAELSLSQMETALDTQCVLFEFGTF